MDDCILIDDDEETAGNRDAVLARKLAGHGEGSVTAQTSESLSCPFCPFLVENHDRISVMQEHVENVHLSFGEEELPEVKQKGLVCPVCSSADFSDIDSLTRHVDEHFHSEPASVGEDQGLAIAIEQEERVLMQSKEMEEFKKLQALHGFAGSSNFEKQSNSALFKAVEKGRMSAVDYHEKRILQKVSERKGVDDSSSATFDVIPNIRGLSTKTPRVKQMFSCSALDHYAASFGDSGWGCGYRNLQMMLSCLFRNTEYAERLKLINMNANGDKFIQVPSITRLQNAVEEAWKQGFDEEGCKQLDGKLASTRKWIGATEIASFLLSCRIRCRIIDFHRPSSSDGKHPALLSWVLDYYKNAAEFKPPLYFQHQGHSRTIVGVEQLQNSQVQLLVLDPSHTPHQMKELLSGAGSKATLKHIRCSLASLKQKQYQIVTVDGSLDEKEFSVSKVLRSIRIPA